MPPKGKKSEPGKKTVEKQKQKVIEDKTFGLKNKKGAKQQKFIEHVHKQVTHGNKSAKQMAKDQEDKYARKEAKAKEALELNALFKPVEQKIGKGVDPKSILCAFFKSGQCKKGDKCKFSHDINVARKSEKRNIFEEEKKDGMEEWSEEQLADVVSKKHGDSNKKLPATSIICKFFLEAVENYKYGWFWSCPTGTKCHYRHALPPGFKLKRDQKKEDKVEEISLEELVEKERAALNSASLTKVTLESFLKWKERKRKEKVAALNKAKDQRKQDFKTGRGNVSGREMFEFNPDLVVDKGDADDGDENFDLSQFRSNDNDAEDAGKEIDLNALASDVRAVDTALITQQQQRLNPDAAKQAPLTNGDIQQNGDDSGKLDMACGGGDESATNFVSDTDAAIAMATAAIAGEGDVIGDVEIDENLFDDDELLDVENELETLDLE